MTNCLTCVANNLETIVAAYYTMLGFSPWDEFAQRRYEENVQSRLIEPDRRTGRTTHSLLEAFARCVTRDVLFLIIKHPSLRMEALRLAQRLGITLYVVAHVLPGTRGHVEAFEDHYHG